MNAIPAGVESALLEAGFSGTEIVILKRLVEDDALTIREIATRTGKSTGILDQAMKKLLQKNIVRRETINDSVKFTITSLDAVLQWMEEDSRRKRELMTRRNQNFETFIHSIEQDKKRPEIQYFDGLAGIAQAYRKLLDCGPEFLMYVPVFCSIEDHPLRDFMVEWFRMRRKKGIFSRVIAHNIPLGRRYQSRDPFEYRQTILVSEDEYPFTFEKIICGDTVACFNYAEKRACLLRYPEMASMEKSLFEGVWRQALKKENPLPSVAIPNLTPEPAPAAIPLRVRALSGLREFFLSRKSIAAFAGIAVLSAGLTYYLYNYTKELQFQRMRETVRAIAATGAFQFDPKDLDALRVESDWKKPEWNKVVKQLQQIRIHNEDVEFVYILRKAKETPTKVEFISDSHSLDPYAIIDLDENGIIDEADQLNWPGQIYEDAPKEAFEAYGGPIANKEIYEDQWGKLISGYAPINNSEGNVVGILAVDMRAQTLDYRVAALFKPILWFLGLFSLFVFIRLAAFNRSLFTELWKAFQIRKAIVILALCAELAFFITWGLYFYMRQQTINEVGTRLMSIVATAAPEIETKNLEELHLPRDMKKDAYQKVFNKLNQIRDANPDIKFIYIMRSIDAKHLFEFVVDADSNYYLPVVGPDFNSDGILDESDENLAPGVRYYADDPTYFREGLIRPTYDRNFYTDQWGIWISGYAPIKSGSGNAILGADIDATDIYASLHGKFIPWLWFMGLLSTFLVLYLVMKKLT